MQHSENVSGTSLDWLLKLSKRSLSNCANGAAFDRKKNEYSSTVLCNSKNVHYMSLNIYILNRITVWKICSRDYYKSAVFSVIKMIIIPPTRKLLLWHLGLFLAEIHCSQTVALLRAQTPRASLAFQLHKCVYEGVKRGVRPQGVCMTDGDRAWEERKKCQKWERNENTQKHTNLLTTIYCIAASHLDFLCHLSSPSPLILSGPLIPSTPLWVWILIFRQIYSSRTFSPWPSAPNLTLIFLSPSVAVHRRPEENFLSGWAAGTGLHVRCQLGRRAEQTAASRLYSQCKYMKLQLCSTNLQHTRLLK